MTVYNMREIAQVRALVSDTHAEDVAEGSNALHGQIDWLRGDVTMKGK